MQQDQDPLGDRIHVLGLATDRAPHPMFVTDDAGRNLYVNAAFARMARRPREALLGFGWYDLIPAEQLSGYLDQFRAGLARGEDFALELHVFAPSGRPLSFNIRMSPLGEIGMDIPSSLWLGAVRNISRQRAAEEHASDLSRRYENMIQHSSTVFLSADATGRVEFVDASDQNAAMRAWIGLNLDDLARDDASARRALRSVIEEGRSATHQVEYQDRVYRFDWYPRYDSNGMNSGIDAIASDVTERARFNEQLRNAFDGVIGVISKLTDLTDPYTRGHEETVADIAATIARRLAVPEQSIEGLRVAARLHDTGKIALPSSLLSRPGPLAAAEFELIKTHVDNARRIFSGIEFPWPEIDAVYEHHERMDGSGYPRGLKGDEISIPGRILAVADVCDAMTSHRPYRPARTLAELVTELQEGSGVHYDADVVGAAVSLIEYGQMPFRQVLGAGRDDATAPIRPD